jgi:hypothetical protein
MEEKRTCTYEDCTKPQKARGCLHERGSVRRTIAGNVLSPALIGRGRWCPGWDSNPHAPSGASAFKAPSSTGSDTRAPTMLALRRNSGAQVGPPLRR